MNHSFLRASTRFEAGQIIDILNDLNLMRAFCTINTTFLFLFFLGNIYQRKETWYKHIFIYKLEQYKSNTRFLSVRGVSTSEDLWLVNTSKK